MLGSSRTYPVPKSLLLAKLRENREIHVREFQTAVADFRKAVIDALAVQVSARNDAMAAARDGLPLDLREMCQGDEYPTAPTNHTDEYDRIIGLLELTTDVNVDMTGDDYRTYIEDEWDWKMDFRNVNMSYRVENRRG